MLDEIVLREPKHGCEVLCEADTNFGRTRDLRVFTVKRLRFRTDWTVTENNANIADFLEWSGFCTFLKDIRASNIEVSEFHQ